MSVSPTGVLSCRIVKPLGKWHGFKGVRDMPSRAKIYTEEGAIDGQELLKQLNNALEELEHKMKASVPIKKVISVGPELLVMA